MALHTLPQTDLSVRAERIRTLYGQSIAARALARAGHTVVEAEDGGQALMIARRNEPPIDR